MKVLLHDGELILEMDCPHMVLPDLKIELYNYLTRKGVVYRLSDRKADGMLVYYRFDLGEALLKDEENRRGGRGL